MRRFGRQASVALGHPALHLDGAANGIDDASELDENAIARPLAPGYRGTASLAGVACAFPWLELLVGFLTAYRKGLPIGVACA
jgi:hypothetical protein